MKPSRRHPSSLLAGTLLLAAVTMLAGCDALGIESASAAAAKREGEGKAAGAACRHAGRAIEDCFALNKRADKAAVFAGWREMNDYMRENQIAEVKPALQAAGAAAAAASAASAGATADGETAPATAEAAPGPRRSQDG